MERSSKNFHNKSLGNENFKNLVEEVSLALTPIRILDDNAEEEKFERINSNVVLFQSPDASYRKLSFI